jgi:hypothetical protein
MVNTTFADLPHEERRALSRKVRLMKNIEDGVPVQVLGKELRLIAGAGRFADGFR